MLEGFKWMHNLMVTQLISFLFFIYPAIIVCHSNFSALRQIIFAAQDLGLTDPGSYVWLTFYNIYSSFHFDMIFTPWITEQEVPQKEVERRRQAFVSVKIVS